MSSCVMKERQLSDLKNVYACCKGGHSILEMNLDKVMQAGFSCMMDVKGDGNCLIYSIIAYLYHTRDVNIFVTTLLSFCDERVGAKLVENPKEILNDITCMRSIALNIRERVKSDWDYKGEWQNHMNDSAIDGLSRNMVMRLLGVNKIICYSLIPDQSHSDKEMRVVEILETEKDLNPAVEEKWHVTLLSTYGYTHYSALFK